MSIKIIYVHPNDLVEIRVINNSELPKTKIEWEYQPRRRSILLSIRSGDKIGFSDASYQFQLETPAGVVKRYLS